LLTEKANSYLRSGAYQWLNVYDGDIKTINQVLTDGVLEDYDVVHMNLCSADYNQIPRVSEALKNSDTKLVLGFDYGPHEYQRWFPHPETLRREITGADAYFYTEPHGIGFYEALVQKKVFIIPHPTDTKLLKKFKTDVEPINTVAIIFHADGAKVALPYLATQNLPKKHKTALLGYQEAKDTYSRFTMTMFHYAQTYTSYQMWIKFIKQARMALDTYDVPAYGRAQTDCAGLGTVCVGSGVVDAQKRLFPKLTTSPWDTRKKRSLLIKLIKNENFKQEQIDFARKEVEYYNLKNSKKRFDAMLDNIKK
jgi:hypothetical protein